MSKTADMEICQLHEFHSSQNTLHKIQYTRLNPGASQTLILCYGAGGRAIDSTVYQSFIDAHLTLTLICIDRWTLPSASVQREPSVARDGPALLSELTSITVELLDSLRIGTFSIAAHSAGAYQMLDLVKRCGDSGRVQNIFPICTHIPPPFLSSIALTWMSKAPNLAFNFITTIDATFPDSSVARLYRRLFTNQATAYGDDYPFVDTQSLQRLLEAHKPTPEQRALSEERHRLDYGFVYARLPGVTAEFLAELWMVLKLRPDVRVTWFTCDNDVFFGPSSVQKVVDSVGEDGDIEVIIVPEASHADIFRRKQVWEEMYRRIILEA